MRGNLALVYIHSRTVFHHAMHASLNGIKENLVMLAIRSSHFRIDFKFWKLPQSTIWTLRQARQSLNSWLDIEEVMWKQRSRNNYLKEGDHNTSFFHTKASNRKQQNWIQGLEDKNL